MDALDLFHFQLNKRIIELSQQTPFAIAMSKDKSTIIETLFSKN